MDTLRLLLFPLLAFGTLGSSDSNQTDYPVGDPRRCRLGNGDAQYRFEILPGVGWDNLQNKEMGMIIQFNFSKCMTSSDGRYLLPDGVYTVPLKSSALETYAELFTHWDNYTSTLSQSINLQGGLQIEEVGISGKFSYEHETIKKQQHLDEAVTTRTQARYLQYTTKLDPDTTISDAFRQRLYKIAADLAMNRTRLAQYDSQLLVRDYGTHVITSVDVGAALVQVDAISLDYVRQFEEQKSTILACASVTFFGVFNISSLRFSSTVAQQDVTTYTKSRSSSRIVTYGGPVFQPQNFSADQWSDSIADDLVALDRSGDPIYYLVTKENLPDIPEATVYMVYDYVKSAVRAYYQHNSIRGCTRESAPNFSFQANIDDGSCEPTKSNFTFGGVYQTCDSNGTDDLCVGMIQTNPQTGDFSCPEGYESVPLHTSFKQSIQSKQVCERCFWILHCCHAQIFYSYATYSANWCAAMGNVSENSGFLFGGLYSDQVTNMLTQAQSCPQKFYPLSLFNNVKVCVSDDYELASQNSLPFAGFYSCKYGNPLSFKERSQRLPNSVLNSYMASKGVESYPHSCPYGYSQHLAIIDNGCSIEYCVKTGALSSLVLPQVQRPPFMDSPRKVYSLMDFDFVVDDDGFVFADQMRGANITAQDYLKKLGYQDIPFETTPAVLSGNTKSRISTHEISSGVIAGIAGGATLVCVIVATLIVLLRRRRKSQSQFEQVY